ncbi:MAG: UvrD-helicase domain-containing protein, partial [Aestuariivirga sp.]
MSSTAFKKKFETTPQQLAAADPRHSVWVSANAGSGKTHVLVERVVRLLLNGADPASILCITYTKAAAAEMAERLFKRLGEWTGLTDEDLSKTLAAMGEKASDKNLLARARRLFTAALETPGGLKIQTIHAFCERLLHLFPVEAGLAPGFRVLDERSAEELRQRANEYVLNEAEHAEGTALAKAFANLSDRLNKEQFDGLIQFYVDTLAKLEPAVLSLEGADCAVALKQALEIDLSVTRESAAAELINLDRVAFAQHAEILRSYGKHAAVDVPMLLLQIATVEDPLPALIRYFTTDDGKKNRAESGLASKPAKMAHPDTAQFLQQQQVLFWQRLLLRNTLDIVDCSADAFILAKAILKRFEDEKRHSGQYDFSDLISRTARLLSNRRATQWVLYKLDKGLTHILLDEAQDTGFDQWQIVDALSQEFFSGEQETKQSPRTLFVVGDQKQSIYSFQGADARAYEAAKQQYVKPNGPLDIEELAISYRSTKPVLEAVNRIFSVEGLQHS